MRHLPRKRIIAILRASSSNFSEGVAPDNGDVLEFLVDAFKVGYEKGKGVR